MNVLSTEEFPSSNCLNFTRGVLIFQITFRLSGEVRNHAIILPKHMICDNYPLTKNLSQTKRQPRSNECRALIARLHYAPA
jgi:hypothetical protein